MDKYTKFILTMIAVGIIGINVQLFKNDIISHANAEVGGKTGLDLMMDFDFVMAVQGIVQNCYVDDDSISC